MERKLIIVIILLFCRLGVQSQEFKSETKLKGFVDSYHALRSSGPYDWMSSRTRFRGELTQQYGQSTAFVSFNLNYNPLYKSAEPFELREAYIDYKEKNWGLRIGKQLVVWGVADALRITDLVSPLDMSEFLARDYDDVRMPVNAIRLFAFTETMKIELIAVPTFQGFVIPMDINNPWSIKIPGSIPMSSPFPPAVNIEMNKTISPAFKFKNIEFGGRLSYAMSGIDFSFVALNTWNKIPAMDYLLSVEVPSSPTFNISNAKLDIIPTHHRMGILGGDFSIPIDEFVIRGEVAYNVNKHFSHNFQREIFTNEEKLKEIKNGKKQIKAYSTAHNSVNWLLGVDWFAGNDWMLSAQFSSESIFDYNNYIETDRNSTLATLNISKELLTNSLKLSAFSYFDLKHEGVFARMSADYSLSDQIHLMIGYDIFHSDDKGIFATYKNNSEGWVKAKYSF